MKISNLFFVFLVGHTMVNPVVVATKRPKRAKLGLCKTDCDKDSDCMAGLLCADEHKEELRAAGYNRRKANCGRAGTRFAEVCFDAKLLKPIGSGGGDPHFRTFDGTKYSYHGECDLILVRSEEVGYSGLGLDLHIRTKLVAGWSLISNAALKIGTDTVEIVNDGSFYLNGETILDFPHVISANVSLSKREMKLDPNNEIGGVNNATRTTLTFHFDGDDSIEILIFKELLFINVRSILRDSEGMMGKQGKVGMLDRDGIPVLDGAKYMGDHWQVRDTEAKLFRETRAPQYPETCILPHTYGRRLRQSDENSRRAIEVCKGVPEEMHDFCIEDVLQTNDVDLAQVYGEVF